MVIYFGQREIIRLEFISYQLKLNIMHLFLSRIGSVQVLHQQAFQDFAPPQLADVILEQNVSCLMIQEEIH